MSAINQNLLHLEVYASNGIESRQCRKNGNTQAFFVVCVVLCFSCAACAVALSLLSALALLLCRSVVADISYLRATQYNIEPVAASTTMCVCNIQL